MTTEIKTTITTEVKKYFRADFLTYGIDNSEKIDFNINYLIPPQTKFTTSNQEHNFNILDTHYDCVVLFYTQSIEKIWNYVYCKEYKTFSTLELNETINLIGAAPTHFIILENVSAICLPIDLVKKLNTKFNISSY